MIIENNCLHMIIENSQFDIIYILNMRLLII